MVKNYKSLNIDQRPILRVALPGQAVAFEAGFDGDVVEHVLAAAALQGQADGLGPDG